MNWDALLMNHCPLCNQPLVRTMVKTFDNHIHCKCGMIVKEDRYREIIADRKYKETEQ